MNLFSENILNQDLADGDLTRYLAFQMVKSGQDYLNTSIANSSLTSADLESFRVFH